MANVRAVKSGNWSDTTVWNTGALPTASDDVYSNNYTVTIDQDVTVLSLRNGSATGITAGGGFTCSTARTITASGSGLVPGSNTLFTYSAASGVSTTINATLASAATAGNLITINNGGTLVTNGNLSTTQSSSGIIINTVSGASLTHTGSVTGSLNGNACIGVATGISATVSITGQITGSGGYGYALWFPGPTNLTIVGNVLNVANYPSIYITASSIVSITGSLTAANYQAFVNTAGGTTTVIGQLTASLMPALVSLGTITLSGPFISSASGILPFSGQGSNGLGNFKLTGITANEYRFAKSTGGTTSLWSSDVTGGAPTTNNVRKGTTYGLSNEFTGTLAVPPTNSVASGVPVDNTTGTAALAPSDVAALVGAQIAAALDSAP